MIIDRISSIFSGKKNNSVQGRTSVPHYGPFDLTRDTVTITEAAVKYNPLNKYSAIAPYNGKLVPSEGIWRQSVNKQESHCGWKMHLYADKSIDYNNMLNCIGPYFDDNDILWKTANDYNALMSLKGGKQEGKAFTIYPKSNRNFEQIARDVDYILRRNNLCTKKSSIIGDNQLGTTGRIFYRYEFKTGNAKNVILDLSDDNDWNLYDSLYDNNRGAGKYLAADMTVKDDPWHNFDPAKSGRIYLDSINGVKIEELESCQKENNSYKLKPNTPYPMKNISDLVLNNTHTVNLSHPYIQQYLDKLQNNQYLLMGRGSDCHIKVGENDTNTSRHHVKIQKMANEFFVIDTSLNGTNAIKKTHYEMCQ